MVRVHGINVRRWARSLGERIVGILRMLEFVLKDSDLLFEIGVLKVKI